jgi:hypothetical protein
MREQPRQTYTCVVAEPSHAVTDGHLDADDQDSDDQGDII